MCGRFSADFSHEDVELLEKFLITDVLAEFGPHYNVAPTQLVACIVPGSRCLRRFHWGLIPHWSDDRSIAAKLINARSETVATKPSFRDSFRRRRCLIPSTGFYEWNSKKSPHLISVRDERIFAFAGIYDRWTSPEGEVVHSCTILTCAPNDFMSSLHDRMPVILEPNDYDAWLLDDGDDLELPSSLLRPLPSERMTAHRVRKLVNSVKNDTIDVIQPCEEPELEQGELF